MTLTLRPELEQFIDEQVKAGHYPSAEAVVEAALADLAVGGRPAAALDADDWAAIAEADAQVERGEGITLEDLRTKYEGRLGIDL